MKKYLCLLLAVFMLLPLFGCAKEPNDLEDPVAYYYCRSADSILFGQEDGVIAKELREAFGRREDIPYLINQYLKGPQSAGLGRTFPKGTELVSIKIENGTAILVLSDSFSTLTALDLTIACACLTRTVCELTGAQRMVVSAASNLLDGNRTVSMSVDDVLILDESDIIIDPN